MDSSSGIKVAGRTPSRNLIVALDAHIRSVFCHSRETPDRQGLTKGSKVSFLYEFDEKGGKALQVQIEQAAEEDTREREVRLESPPMHPSPCRAQS